MVIQDAELATLANGPQGVALYIISSVLYPLVATNWEESGTGIDFPFKASGGVVCTHRLADLCRPAVNCMDGTVQSLAYKHSHTTPY